MEMEEMARELKRQEAELQDHKVNVIAPAKVAVEQSAKDIENTRAVYTAASQDHGAKVTALEAAHQEANIKQGAIHGLISAIQTRFGQDALKRYVTRGAELGMGVVEIVAESAGGAGALQD